MNDRFYAIIAIDCDRSKDYDELNWSHHKCRTVGFFKTFEEAKETLIYCSELIWELTGRYAAIESLNHGIMQHYKDPIKWYSYNKCMDIYLECKCPPVFERVVSLWG